jgi:hypothetical protein
MEGSTELLDLALNGDWTVRANTSREELLSALENIIQGETGRRIRMEPREVERTVVVARGGLTPEFLNQAREGRLPTLDFYSQVKDGKGGMGGGDTQAFIKWMADWLNLRIVDETDRQTQKVPFDWRIHDDSAEMSMGDRREEMTAAVLKNVEAQTGVSFTREKRRVEVWFVTEQPQ